MAALALYYPWMHFQHDNWVKLALLTWDGMVRIRSTAIWDRDSDVVRQIAAETDFLTDEQPSREALHHVATRFLNIVSDHRDQLAERYGRQAFQTEFRMPPSQMPGALDDNADFARFWIYTGPHLSKVTDILRAALVDADLCIERDRTDGTWLGLHPTVGAVYTACLADAVATENLLSPATDDARMHRAVGALDQAVDLLLGDLPPRATRDDPDLAYLHIGLEAVLRPTGLYAVPVGNLIRFRERYAAELSAFREHIAGLAPSLAPIAAVESPAVARAHLEALYRSKTQPQLDELRGALRGMGIESTVGVLGLKVDVPAAAGTLVGGAAAAGGHLAVAATAVAMTVLPYLTGRISAHRERARSSPVAYLLAAERNLTGRSLLDRIRSR
ncbi:hypothetical protein DFJ67_0145 [Asanoa ferruginea]|uniref:Uncharacterized protein n=1 Tax=Asanoa ferruginea TaxID=53367 RepID=A0A3D9ZKL3_9ACTN|nr:DUF6236 family protein [Asanoa ferruginea]REF94230.1 hypothetical protein DFJ67_0145 [Asanoa ferruginea]GIF49822.1 hypothetical protein Afe04nite_43610 [Asanoa ferruginea]